MTRTIYAGSIPVASTKYRHTLEVDGDWVDVDLENLDDLVTRVPRLRFTLVYPFTRPYAGEVQGDGGITLRQIIDAVRKGFAAMYRGATHQQMANMHNQIVEGAYGRAVHAVGDLVIERIELDEASHTLDIAVGS